MRRGFLKLPALLAMVALSSLLAWTYPVAAVTLTGAGATFPAPLYDRYFEEYNSQTGEKTLYQAVGSSEGVQQLLSRTVDFGATDVYIQDDQLPAEDDDILHIPTCVGAVVLIYNLPGNPTLRLNPDLLEAIFLGEIEFWDHPDIARVNERLDLPGIPIRIVHRHDGSGTTHVFSEYLTAVGTNWGTRVGIGTTLDWPVGYGAMGNDGVALMVERIRGSIGYSELSFAVERSLPMAELENRSGQYIPPSFASVSEAAAVSTPADTRISLINTAAPSGYPIATFSWIVVHREQEYGNRSLARAEKLANLLQWMVTDAQALNEGALYAPLPEPAQRQALRQLRTMTYRSQPLQVREGAIP